MSESSDRKQPRKRGPSPEQRSESPVPSKLTKVDDTASELPLNTDDNKKEEDNGPVSTEAKKHNGKEEESGLHLQTGQAGESSAAAAVNNPVSANSAEEKAQSAEEKAQSAEEKAQSSEAHGAHAVKADATGDAKNGRPSTSLDHQSDSAAIAAAEALALLTGIGDGREKSKETPCSSKKAEHQKQGHKVNRNERVTVKERSKPERGFQAQAAAADSSTSLRVDREEEDAEDPDVDEDDDSISGSSSTPSSSFPSDNEDNDDGECAIVSVMAPQIRQSVSLLAEVQMRLDTLEKKSARLHQRLELKMNRQRRPHLDQRSAIAKVIPGFWVTALLNHPLLSAHIDETDEDALSYMTDLEIESFKNNKLGYRIGFHFRRNPYFQNIIIVKELHLGMGGSPVSFSNPILWLRGQNLTANREPWKSALGVYQTFFNWFSDHSNPGRDEIAQILKDDLYRNPLRYYLTPLWEPRENGSGTTSGPRAADNSKGDDCVVISDSDDDQEQEEESGRGRSKEEEEDDEEEEEDEEPRENAGGSDSDEEDEEGESFGEKDEEVDVEDVDESSRGKEVRRQEEEEDVDVDEEDQS